MLKAAATCNTEEIPDRLERLRKDVAEKAAVAKHVAEKYGFPLIELQGKTKRCADFFLHTH